jgi:hypothetical protein
MKRITHAEYAEWVTNNRPDYTVVGQVVNTSTKIEHQHIATGKAWMCTPEKFKSGVGHPELTRVNKSPSKRTHSQYVEWVKNNRSDYQVIGTYKNVKTKIIHKHIDSGIEWMCAPEKFMKGISPTELTGCERYDTNKYKKLIHDNNIPVTVIGEYTRKEIPILHKCTITGIEFMLAPTVIRNNTNYRYTHKITDTESYKQWLAENRPELVITEPYVSSRVEINHLHVTTGDCWKVRPNNVQQGQHHPCESLNGMSRKSIEWITSVNPNAQHGLSGGEYMIEGIGKVDGYDPTTNTVYEFHGDFWHGNPDVFDSEDTNPVTNTNFGELHQRTVSRDQSIRDEGYNLVTIWESEFNKLSDSSTSSPT